MSGVGRDFNDILREEGVDALRASFDRGAKANGPEELPGDSRAEHGSGNPFRFLLYRDFAKDCKKEWQVENLLGTGEFSCFFGEPSAGKSVLVEDMLLHAAAAGREWHGRRMKGGLAVFFALERHQVVIRRARAFEITTGLADLPFVVVPGPINFLDWKETVPRVLDTIHRAEDTYGMGLSLLGIDTVSAALFGGDENSPKDMGSFVNAVRHIQESASGHIVVIHHQPHDAARLRGHGSLLGAVDLTAEVVKANGHQLIVRKINDGPEDQTISFTLESVVIHTGPEGTETTAPVVVPMVGAPKSKAGKKAKLTASAKIALHALEEALAELGKLPDSPFGIPDCTNVVTSDQWRQFAYKRGIAPSGEKEAQQKAFRRAHEALVAAKVVGVMEPYVWRVW